MVFFSWDVFLHSRVTGACPVTTDLIMRVNVRTTTTTATTTTTTTNNNSSSNNNNNNNNYYYYYYYYYSISQIACRISQ